MVVGVFPGLLLVFMEKLLVSEAIERAGTCTWMEMSFFYNLLVYKS